MLPRTGTLRRRGSTFLRERINKVCACAESAVRRQRKEG